MDFKQKITDYSLRHYKLVTVLMVAFALALGALIPRIKVDTDPENMLSPDEPVRVFHNRNKEQFVLHDIVVLGIVNEKDPNGVFNPKSLARIYELTEFAKTELHWPDPTDSNKQVGVIEVDILAPSTVDHIGQGGPGVVNFEWLMKKPPTTREEALKIREKAMSNPLLKGTIVSEDGKAICIYLPLTSKDLSYDVYREFKKRIPVINLWALIKDYVIYEELSEDEKLALNELCKIVVHGSENVKDFEKSLICLSYFLGWHNFEKGIKIIENVLDSEQWQKTSPSEQQTVQELDALLKTAIVNVEKGNYDQDTRGLYKHWLSFTRLYLKLLRNHNLSGQVLASSVLSFCHNTASRLEIAKRLLDSSEIEIELSKIKSTLGAFGDEYHITGLPVAEDTFGYEMFVQMAISAPLAMVVIFILMLVFFRKLVLILAPMIVAMVSVISTMGLLIGLGFPVHIMSSMIPIFLMPIAVVDSVHILSEFFDLYSKEKGRRGTILEVMGNLFMPMLYTSLTSAAGFLSLALTPIPPVQVFGVFVAIGIMIAWVCTVTFVPAYVMMISDKALENFGRVAQHGEKKTWLTRLLHSGGRFTYTKAKPILVIMLIITVVAIYGITRIRINDNPVKWFSKRHPIRRADIVLNEHFGGTYMAYLVLDPNEDKTIPTEYISDLRKRFSGKILTMKEQFPNAGNIIEEVEKVVLKQATQAKTKQELLDKVSDFAGKKLDTAKQKDVDLWYEVADFFELEKERIKIFKQPEMLRYIAGLQEHLKKTGLVGKSNSVSDVVKKVHQELIDGKPENYKIPDSSAAVAQCLLQFQSSHNPDDLWHLVTMDYMHANIWLQLTSGDNKDMQKVVKAVDDFFRENPPPSSIKYNWAGLTYINVVWQDKMVWGMLQSFLGSFIIVFIMMAILFRSVLWGLICMIPLTITIGAIYGIIGLAGKDYDMPVAVLSALSLGMAVDFAIHFLERARSTYRQSNSWEKASPEMFGEPARAISRNVIVIAIGFLPLLAAPLVPYKTVGIFVCAIMAVSGVVTLMVLPAIVRVLEKKLFKAMAEPMGPSCNCAFCAIISAASVLLVAVNVHQFAIVKWSTLAWISIIAIPIMALTCGIMSRRQACKVMDEHKEKKSEV